jgi:hypothetical protein
VQEIADLQTKLAKMAEQLEIKDKELDDKNAKMAEAAALTFRNNRRLSVTRRVHEKKLIS